MVDSGKRSCENKQTFVIVLYCLAEKFNLIECCNKAKGRISKRVFQDNKTRQIFRKNEHFLPPDTHTHIRGLEMFVFQKVLCALFS